MPGIGARARAGGMGSMQVLQGGEAQPSVDVYALGMVGLEMMRGSTDLPVDSEARGFYRGAHGVSRSIGWRVVQCRSSAAGG